MMLCTCPVFPAIADIIYNAGCRLYFLVMIDFRSFVVVSELVIKV